MPAVRRHPTTRYRDRRTNDPNYEKHVEEALTSITTGEYSSFRDAARSTGIPRSTLTDRGKCRHNSHKIASTKRQLLTPEEEDVLVQWCILRGQIGEPWTSSDLRNEAEMISGKTVGSHWHRKFEKRHPEIFAAKTSKLDPKRAKHFNETVINDYFDQQEELERRYGGIPPEHRWNMDEKGVQMGGGRKKCSKKFYFLRSQKHRYRIQSDNLELVTILECVSAAGDVVPPSFCLQNGTAPDLRTLEDHEWGSVYFSESGWTDTYNCENWLNEVFIPYAKERRVDSSKPIVLYMDGHDTHEAPALKRAVYKRLDDEDLEIIIFCFPSKTTHKCQPLDVVLFAHVERKWQEVCNKCIKDRITINRYNVIPLYVRGTQGAMTRKLIEVAFEKTGIYPINRRVFEPEDFAPSKASSSIAHVPDTFPDDVPSSDPMVPSDVEDEDFGDETDSSDSDSRSGSDSEDLQNSTIRLEDSDSESEGGLDGLEGESNVGHHADGSGMEADGDEKTWIGQDEDLKPEPVFSGFMASIANIENNTIHMTRSSTAGLNLFSVAPPKIVSLGEDEQLSTNERLQELRHLRQQLTGTYQCLGHAIAQLSASNAHCTTIRRELDHVRQQLEHATKKKERGSKKIKARFLTSRSLRAEFEREDAERKERERLAEEKNKQKEVEKAETARRILSDSRDRNFAGSLASYKKDDLQALALALQLLDDGTKDDLKTRISEKFEDDPSLKQTPRFFGLFNKSRRRANGPNDGNDPAITADRHTAQSCNAPLIPVSASSSHLDSTAQPPPTLIQHYPIPFHQPIAGPSTGNPTYYYPYPTPFNPPLNGIHPPSHSESPFNPYHTFQIPTNY